MTTNYNHNNIKPIIFNFTENELLIGNIYKPLSLYKNKKTNNYFGDPNFEFPRDFVIQFADVFDNKYCISYNTSPDKTKNTLMIFNKNNPNTLQSIPINIYGNRTNYFDYWFRHAYRPNRIYITDFDGIKVFDFELNLIFFKQVKDSITPDVYGFKIDPNNWNNIWYWSVKDASEYSVINNLNRDNYDLYNSNTGIEEICEYIET